MSKAQIRVSAPVLFAVGDYLNGATLTEPQWVRSGAAEVDADKAEALERDGYADIISRDGQANVWAPCCGGSHDHG